MSETPEEILERMTESAHADHPTPEQIADLIARVQAGVGPPGGGGGTNGPTGSEIGGSASFGGPAVWTFAAVAIVGLGLAGLGLAGLGVARPWETPVPVAPLSAPLPIEVPVEAPVVEEALVEAPGIVEAPASPQRAPRPSEVALLDPARAALGTRPARALRLTSRHRRLYPSGLLGQEREMIAIEALLRLHRRSAAETRAARFERRYPGSAHALRIQNMLGRTF